MAVEDLEGLRGKIYAQRVRLLLRRGDGSILFGQRPAEGLLGGLWELPGGVLEPGEVALHAAHGAVAVGRGRGAGLGQAGDLP